MDLRVVPGFIHGLFKKLMYLPFAGCQVIPFWQYSHPNMRFFHIVEMEIEMEESLRYLFLKIFTQIEFFVWNNLHEVEEKKALFLVVNF